MLSHDNVEISLCYRLGLAWLSARQPVAQAAREDDPMDKKAEGSVGTAKKDLLGPAAAPGSNHVMPKSQQLLMHGNYHVMQARKGSGND